MDNQLINIKVKDDQQLVSARDLHKALEVKRKFSLWVNDNFKHFEEGIDYEGVLTRTPYNPSYPDKLQELQDYAVTLDMAKELCMMSKTPKGKEVRKYFIQVEKDWNSPDKIMERALQIAHSRVKKLEMQNKNLTGKGYTQSKSFPYKDKKGQEHIKLSTYWTQLGRKLIYDVLKENGTLPLIERDDVE